MHDMAEIFEHADLYRRYQAFERDSHQHCLNSVINVDAKRFFESTFSLMSSSEFFYFLRGLPAARRNVLLRRYAMGFGRWLQERNQELSEEGTATVIDEIPVRGRIVEILSILGYPSHP